MTAADPADTSAWPGDTVVADEAWLRGVPRLGEEAIAVAVLPRAVVVADHVVLRNDRSVERHAAQDEVVLQGDLMLASLNEQVHQRPHRVVRVAPIRRGHVAVDAHPAYDHLLPGPK